MVGTRKSVAMYNFIVLIFLCIFMCSAQQLSNTCEDCPSNPGNTRSVRIFFMSSANETGDWTDNFISRAISTNKTKKIGLNVTHLVTECEGRRIITIQGTVNGPEQTYEVPQGVHAKPEGKLSFDPKCGTNVVILHNGAIIQKININDGTNSAAYTNRPLKDNELFQVRLIKRTSDSSSAIGIGVVTTTTSNIELQKYMYQSPSAWSYIHSNVYHNGKDIHSNYGKNLNDVKAGDTVGVMRTETGKLHFFLNGVDQGVAVQSIPSPVYGLLELYVNGETAVIV